MKFVDYLNKVPPKNVKTDDERLLERLVETGHNSIQSYCIERREEKKASGFLIQVEGDGEWSEKSYSKCYTSLYRHKFPYLIENNDNYISGKKTDVRLDLGDDSNDGCSGPRIPISKDKAFCKSVISSLLKLLGEDGFKQIDLKEVPVYAAEIKSCQKSSIFHPFSSTYHEEGKLTDKLEGYVIEFHLRW